MKHQMQQAPHEHAGGVDQEVPLQQSGQLFIGWSDLQATLMQQLPEGVLQLGCPFTRSALPAAHVLPPRMLPAHANVRCWRPGLQMCDPRTAL
jgi:hypothetical protein